MEKCWLGTYYKMIGQKLMNMFYPSQNLQQLCINSMDKPRMSQKLILPNSDFGNTVPCTS